MEMVLDVYKRPLDPCYPVVCMDKEFGIPEQQMDLVLFLDGYEGKEMALEAGLEE